MEKADSMGVEIGKVIHFYDKIKVAVVELDKKVKKGENIRIKGATSDLQQKIDSMQIDHKNIDEAKPGDSIGLKVADQVRVNDKVYRI